MKTIIISDTHKRINKIVNLLTTAQDIGRIVHLGDVSQDAEDLGSMFPSKELIAVCGNNDYDWKYPISTRFEIGEYSFFASHGHSFGVKMGLDKLYARGKELGVDFILFGHTHVKHEEKRGDITLLNPSNRYYILFDEQGEYKFMPLLV